MKMFESNLKYQYYATICANIISIAHGAAVGWLSPFLPILLSKDTPLPTGPINSEQASWIGSLLCFGALIGSLIFGWMSDKFGRKFSACVIAIPQILSWSLIIFAKSVSYLYLARLLVGLAAGGVFVVIPLYVTEISDSNIRGQLGSIMIFCLNFGILLCFIAGTVLSYSTVQILMLLLPVLYLISFVFLPETPYFLMKISKHAEAEKSLKYFRGYDKNSSDFDDLRIELEKLNLLMKNNENDLNDEQNKLNKITLNDFKSKPAIKATLIGLLMVWMNQFSGSFALINYTASIFEESKTGLDPNISAIIVGIIQIFGSYLSAYLVDRINRRILYTSTALFSSFGLFIMGIYSYLKLLNIDLTSVNWIPVASLSFVIFIASAGLLPLTFIVTSEIFPSKIRGFGNSFCMLIMWVFAFIVIKYFSTFVNALGMHGCMFLFSGCCFTGFLLYALFIPETKGKTFDEIFESLDNPKKIKNFKPEIIEEH